MDDVSEESDNCELEDPSLETLQQLVSDRAELMENVDKQVLTLNAV